MGRVVVDFTLANYSDVLAVEEGRLTPDKVRQVTMRGVVDTGSTRLVLPPSVATHLGLSPAGDTRVRYADQRRDVRPMVKNAWVSLLGRASTFSAVLEPDREDALVGAIVLEELDLVVDCTSQTLKPRDPERILSEIE